MQRLPCTQSDTAHLEWLPKTSSSYGVDLSYGEVYGSDSKASHGGHISLQNVVDMDDSHVDRFSNILPSYSYGSPAVSDPCLPILDFLFFDRSDNLEYQGNPIG
ncbi:uncharacterized protein BO96DRAFT_485763 [Aspergillus niger CBS 101883]|uniref:Uncharacterized protein n=2 Tax=Aspergillus niger TaxID=5061 RepID=A2Q8C5_ASPNC|nr:uncharacterized protein BO96DRAFT_485763 [Aspergillus niger CBS 101883]XP_059599595.1 hypothetical protein An01g03850 [Aspergillus niger]PYH51938.1 hypothetical protein BO96DRAFT_485763 [Aspergillus niger CBS 101883]CAK36922.1 hypothetical protein An01g03850 [Aspergillus niger]